MVRFIPFSSSKISVWNQNTDCKNPEERIADVEQ